MVQRKKLTKGYVLQLLDESECEHWDKGNSTPGSNENNSYYVSEISDVDILDEFFTVGNKWTIYF